MTLANPTAPHQITKTTFTRNKIAGEVRTFDASNGARVEEIVEDGSPMQALADAAIQRHRNGKSRKLP